jgi:pro-sigmaK processing inhibitor BofA
MVQLNTPQPAEIVVITCLLFILYRVACGLVPRHPRIVDLFCGLILGIAFLKVLNLLGAPISLHIPLNGWTIAAVGLLGLPGLLLLLLAKLILL